MASWRHSFIRRNMFLYTFATLHPPFPVFSRVQSASLRVLPSTSAELIFMCLLCVGVCVSRRGRGERGVFGVAAVAGAPAAPVISSSTPNGGWCTCTAFPLYLEYILPGKYLCCAIFIWMSRSLCTWAAQASTLTKSFSICRRFRGHYTWLSET